ncbi:hypothetical protein AKJ09_07218 [Labilithrix luteola]|uniref:ABM domain-containing protein n=1 Tax=Labilithrix luteola TaxID=1391654 RepID=A0A0K1Q568_9BACT|nr:antibiotic biosynthesis monooxygenase [Labilithrix luteola]AKV00555.1 hypothetical protein AKJ09_07218 [Labilithrix luteola]
MTIPSSSASYHSLPEGTVFVVNVIHAKPGHQEAALAVIREIVHYVAERRKEFLWSTLATSIDGDTVVNIEAITGPGDVETFFSDTTFADKFRRLDDIGRYEFHVYRARDLVLPRT